MAGLYTIGVNYLKNQFPISNGGVAGLILDSLQFTSNSIDTSKITNVGMWTSYIQQFLFNNTRLQPTIQNSTYQFGNQSTVNNVNRPYTIMMIFWLVTFIVLTLSIIISSIIQCVKDKNDQKEGQKLKFKKSRTKRHIICRKRSKRIMILVSMCLFLLLWVVFISMVCAAQYLVSSKFYRNTTSNSNTSHQSYDSVDDAVALTFNYLNNFFNIITNQTGTFLGTSLAVLSSNIRSQMNSSLVSFGGEVLLVFNITDLFNTAQMLLTSLNEVVTSMTYINSNCQNTLGAIDNTKGTIYVYQGNVKQYLTNICTQLNNYPSLQTTCQMLQAQNAQFQTNIQTAIVSSTSSVIMLFVLKQYNINITAITNSFNIIDTSFKVQLSQLLNNTVNSFDISSYLTSVTQLWSNLAIMAKPSFTTFSSYSTVLSSAFETASKYENLIIIILIFLIFITILLVLLFSFRDSIQDPSINGCVNFFIQFLFLFVSIISAILSIGVIIVANFSQSEICNQINTTSGVNVLDQMLNNKISTPWTALSASIAASNQQISIKLPQPTDILSGVKDRCMNTSIGLLAVLGMGNFVNVTQIVRSTTIRQIVLNSKNDSLNAFYKVNPAQIIPANITAFFAQTSSIVTYFDGIDYSSGNQQLQIPLVGIVDFQGFFNQLSTFAINSSNAIGWTTDLRYMNDTINQLLKLAPNLTKIQNDTTLLLINFQTLQTYRANSFLMNKLLSTISNVQALFSNPVLLTSLFSAIYDNDITINLLNSVEQIIGFGINNITNSMLPCGNLSIAFAALSTTICSSTNFNVGLATFGIILLIETIICQIVSIIVVISISLRMSKEINVSRC